MNLKSLIGIRDTSVALIAVLSISLMMASCSKKPAELQEEGMKAFAASQYKEAQEYFSDGIEKGATTQLYAGFIAANLATGKYPQINSAYNAFSDQIHSYVVGRYGMMYSLGAGIVKNLAPYNVNGQNVLPSDFPQTIAQQARADSSGFMMVRQQIDGVVKK